MKTSIRFFIVAFLLLTFSNSCGSDGGIGGTGISVGTITGFGSVFVNGVEFNTDDAVIMVDGAPATESNLGIGMVVTVEGTFDNNGITGKADRITYEELVKGQVDAIDDLNQKSLAVLGQTIFITDDTVFDGVSFETLEMGDFVEVSGLRTSSGEVEATRIKLLSATEFEITGVVENLNPLEMTFTIDDVVIDFTDAVLENLPDDTLSDGLRVEVESNEGFGGGVLIASSVELQESILENAKGIRVEIQGVVTSFRSPSDFEVNGIPVRTDDNTSYEHGFESDTELDAKVEIEGRVDESGVILADEVEFLVKNAVEIEANVERVDTVNRTLGILGITVNVQDLTDFRDASGAELRPLDMGDIQIGNELEVSGILVDNIFIATRVFRVNPVSKVSLKGPVGAVADPDIEILGVIVTSTVETNFVNSTETPISAAEFFEEVQIGSLVEAEGELLDGNIISATKVEFE